MNGRDYFVGQHPATPDYHGALLGDPHRILAYERALRAVVRPGDVVLDLGCGTGVLAMLAARLGARVHAVESSPVAHLAAQLIAHNQLEHSITLHHADMRDLPVAEPVDLIVSDFMGRFLVDDGMLGLLDLAQRWAKPSARWCPGQVTLMLAPVLAAIPTVQAVATPILGLDFSPARAWALNHCYGATLAPNALLGEPQPFHRLELPGPIAPFDATLSMTIRRGGALTALAGWLDASLTPSVTLSAAPGVMTHWGQYLFPIPATIVSPGDVLRAHVQLVPPATAPEWAWQVELWRDGACIAGFDQQSAAPLRELPAAATRPRLDRAGVQASKQAAVAAYAAGDLALARAQLEHAVRDAAPDDAALTASIYEQLGLTLQALGDDAGAIRAFLRAIDGDPASHERAVRHLVDSLARAGRVVDAQTWLATYQANFGAHPQFG